MRRKRCRGFSVFSISCRTARLVAVMSCLIIRNLIFFVRTTEAGAPLLRWRGKINARRPASTPSPCDKHQETTLSPRLLDHPPALHGGALEGAEDEALEGKADEADDGQRGQHHVRLEELL